MTEQIVPTSPRRDIDADVAALWEVLEAGGTVLAQGTGGYTIAGGGKEGAIRINAAKGRPSYKRLGLMLTDVGQSQIQIFTPEKRDIIDCVTQDYNLPLGMIARYNADHPLMKQLDDEMLRLCTANGTISATLNMGGFFLHAINTRPVEDMIPVFASSANRSGTGVKYRVEDIEPEVVAACDLVIDYGPAKFPSKIASTQINFETMELVRWGICAESIAWVLKRHYGIDLPPDPGREVSPNGHVNEFALMDAE